MTPTRRALIDRAAELASRIALAPPSTLLRAAGWMIQKYAAAANPGLAVEIALHYQLLADHPQVQQHAELQCHFRSEVDAWLERAAELSPACARPPGEGWVSCDVLRPRSAGRTRATERSSR